MIGGSCDLCFRGVGELGLSTDCSLKQARGRVMQLRGVKEDSF